MVPRKKEESEPEDEEFVKVDKRAPRDEAPPEEPPAPAEPQPAAEPAPEAAPEAGGRMPLDVYSLLRMSVGMYAEQAWVHLGLRMDPTTGKTETNLPLAKVAIDILAFMTEQLQPDLDDSEKRELEQLLANLRINYVQRA
jgi:Domain of unknown function (DUF1844)